jgi:hypothetical protein
MLTPNTGKLVSSTGSKAQCIAQAIEVIMPNVSQFSFIILFCKEANVVKNKILIAALLHL